MKIALICLCAASVALLLWSERREKQRPAALAKLTASLCFVAVAITSGATDSALGMYILAGLCLSLAGDMFLVSSRKTLFLCGMGAFGAAHIAYLIGFLVGSLPWNELWPAGLGAIFVLMLMTWRWLSPQLLPQWRLPVAIYSAIITLMVAIAAAGVTAGHLPFAFFIGAVMFALSDVSVARDRLTAKDPQSRIWGLPLYYGSQMVLAYHL